MAGILFVGAGNGKIVSYNGTSWDVSTTLAGQGTIRSLAHFNDSLFAGTAGGKVFRYHSPDWDEAVNLNATPYSLASYNNSLFAGTDTKVYVTSDTITWNESTNISDASGIRSLTVFNDTLFAGSGNTGKIHTFNGTAWDLNTDLGDGYVCSMVEFNSSLFAALGDSGDGDIYYYNGTTWNLSSTFSGAIDIYGLGVWNNSIFAGIQDKTIISSDGLTWNESTSAITQQANFISYDSILHTGGANGDGIYNFNGTTWATSTNIGDSIGSMAVDLSVYPFTVTTQAASDVSYTTATGNGNLSIISGATSAIRGIAYDTSSGVDITNNIESESGTYGDGAYSLSLSGLSLNTTYYIKAFASNSAGLTYGNETNFTTLSAPRTVIYANQKVAQMFSLPKTASLNRVNLSMSRSVGGTPVSSNIVIEIQENDTVNNIPSGSVVTRDVESFGDSGYKNFYFTDKPLLKGNDKYWIIASANDADFDNAYNWSSTSNADNTRYSAVGNTWSNTTTAAMNFSAFVPHDRFNYQSTQGTQTVVENYTAGDDFYVVNQQTDMERIFNDITVVGRGDGINQLSARSIDTTSISVYGRRQQKIEDKSLTTASDCQCVADTLIGKYASPVTVFDLDMTDPNLTADMGDKVAIFSDIRNINSSDYRIISTEDYANIYEGDRITFNLNNAKTSILTDIDKIKKDKDLQNTYGQGATNLFQLQAEDNCDDDDGLNLRFYIPDEAKSINSVKMRWGRKPFRAYSLATCGGGAISQTTCDGGSFSETSAGNISPITLNSYNITAENEGNAISGVTTGGPIRLIAFIPPPQTFNPSCGGTTFGYTQLSGYTRNQTGYCRYVSADLCVWDTNVPGFITCIGNFSECLGNKTTLFFNAYTNTSYDESRYRLASEYNIPAEGIAPSDIVGLQAQSANNHTHIVSVGDHSHCVVVPNHTHNINYGIFEPVSEDAVCVDVFVDTESGTPIHTFTGIPTNYTYPVDIELSSYITTTGWHCIYIQPKYDSGAEGTCHDARLHANAYVQIYIESK